MIPSWLHIVRLLSLAAGFACALMIGWEVANDPQEIGVMNVVWPIAGLYVGPAAVWAYRRYGKLATRRATNLARARHEHPPRERTPYPMVIEKGAGHCGAGCTLGDICAEWLGYFAPGLLGAFGWHYLFNERTFAVWALDFVLAFCFGVAFQYFAIVPMRHLGTAAGIWAAIRADALSLTAWQVGMYSFMAFAHLFIFAQLIGASLTVTTPESWLMMQLAMICGLLTSYPVNAWLIRAGVKERM